MAPERRNQLVLAVLVVILLGAVYRAMGPTAGVPSGASNEVTQAGRTPGGSVRAVEAPDVHLEALDRARVKPEAGERNLFRFRARAAAAPDAARVSRLPPPVPVAAGPPPAPTVPPIALKFIGVVEATEKSQTYAVLRDDRGVYHGREGDIIEGRYRILRIGAESIDLAYVDGRGRQTIRLGS